MEVEIRSVLILLIRFNLGYHSMFPTTWSYVLGLDYCAVSWHPSRNDQHDYL